MVIRFYGCGFGGQAPEFTYPDAMILVLTTFPADGDADAFARTLVDERLAACVTVLGPMQSVYRWQGEVASAAERQLLIKTKAANLAALEQRVHALHPYDVPEFLVVPIERGSAAYLAWLEGSC